MYSVHQNVQILIALLKKYEIKDLVISAGTRHIPLVFSVEEDVFFNCYSIVDERSAGFFALGLIEKLKRPVAIVCTSGTAAANYVSAANEAFYQHLPLVILTSDRHPYYLNQQENQCIPQMGLYKDVCKKVVNLPIVRDEKDIWYCSRLVNEALLELDHREKGPVHINFPIDDNYPIEQGTFKFDLKQLPDVRKISRLMLEDGLDKWESVAERLRNSDTLIIYGQTGVISQKEMDTIERFCRKYNCVISTDHLSNLHCAGSIDTYIFGSLMQPNDYIELCPDVVITMYGNSLTPVKAKLLGVSGKFEHWHVSKEGIVSDAFRCQSDIIECSPKKFFEMFNKLTSEELVTNSYYEKWNSKKNEKMVKDGDALLEYSSVYADQQLLARLPQNCMLHISNSNSVRITSYFDIDPSIEIFCNRGTCGIDGSMSSFIAQASISVGLAFMIIGDLSFFYDMNALWNHYVGNNVRIMVCNNSGGALFHSSYYNQVQTFPTIDRHIAAEHTTSVRGWAESRGFKYLVASDEKSFDTNIEEFLGASSPSPIIFEIITDKDVDVRQMNVMLNSFRPDGERKLTSIASKLPEPTKRKIKKLLGRQ